MFLPMRVVSTLVVVNLALATPRDAQSWQAVNPCPSEAGLPLLMTDGTVLVHSPSSRDWYRLTPDEFGDYANGTWDQIARMPPGYGPLYFASAVLSDGRVIVMGGEYNFGSAVWTNLGALYDPLANAWVTRPAPAGWANIGDAQCVVLPDGRFFLANALDSRCAVLDPAMLSWSPFGSGKFDSNNEEGWTLLPDGTVLAVDVSAAPHSERFLPTSGTWISAGTVPVNLVDGGEIGPAALRPDGTVFATGATGHTAIYTPPAVLADTGSWIAGPDFPLLNGNQLVIADGPGCLLPSGNVLVSASPGIFVTPTRFFEFDGTTLASVPHPPHANVISCYQCNMLILPTGQVLFTDQGSDVELYDPAGAPDNAWRPTISSYPTIIVPGPTYVITGTQFNGLSQAAFYGDDSTNATNYPLVRLTSLQSGRVVYARTFDHSTMAVATGSLPTSTHFTIPPRVEVGPHLLEVVVNGIASSPVQVLRVFHVRAAGPPTADVVRHL